MLSLLELGRLSNTLQYYNPWVRESKHCCMFLVDTSMESGISDDYAIPPDAMSCGEDSTEWSSLVLRLNLNGAAVIADSPSRCAKTGVLDKSGHLAKLGGKLKTWRRRFFVLSNGKLRYWKTQVSFPTILKYQFY